MIYNVKYATDPILIVQGDEIDFTIPIFEWDGEQWIDYDLTGKNLQMVIVNNHGTVIAEWTTELTGGMSQVTVDADAINVISCCGSFDGQLVELSPQLTLWKGIVKITKGLI